MLWLSWAGTPSTAQDSAPPQATLQYLVEITTAEGKTYTGHYRNKPDVVHLYTEEGRVEIPKSQIKDLKWVKRLTALAPPPRPLGPPDDALAAKRRLEEEAAQTALDEDLSEETLNQIQVVYPQELRRLARELSRIDVQRRKLAKERAETKEQMLALGTLPRSPVLAPREEVVHLTLHHAITSSLQNNPDFLVEFYKTVSAAEGVPQAVAVFDPTISGRALLGRSRTPFQLGLSAPDPRSLGVGRAKTQEYGISVQKRFTLGTTLDLSWSQLRSRRLNRGVTGLNPTYEPRATLTLRQPLLRGFGFEVNKAPILLAENQKQTSQVQFVNALMQAVVRIEETYWNLVLFEEQLKNQERALLGSINLLENSREKRKEGEGSLLDIAIAKSGVALRREEVIVAESQLERSRDTMVRFFRPPSDTTKWDLFLVPLDRPDPTETEGQQVERCVQVATLRRPDLRGARLQLQAARLRLTIAKNNALPSVDLTSSFTQEGLGGHNTTAWSRFGSRRFYSWSVGLEVQLPLFLRSERAQERAARAELNGAEAALRAQISNVAVEIRSLVRDIRTTRARISAADSARLLAAKRLYATREYLKAGAALPRDLLDDLATLAQARTRVVQAKIDHRLAVSRLRLAQGTILDPYITTLPPRYAEVIMGSGLGARWERSAAPR